MPEPREPQQPESEKKIAQKELELQFEELLQVKVGVETSKASIKKYYQDGNAPVILVTPSYDIYISDKSHAVIIDSNMIDGNEFVKGYARKRGKEFKLDPIKDDEYYATHYDRLFSIRTNRDNSLPFNLIVNEVVTKKITSFMES